MSVVYVSTQNARITKQSRRLVICTNDEIILEIPDFKIERLVIFGNAHITTPALAFLLDKGIETSFLTVKGRFRGRLMGRVSKNVFLKQNQFFRIQDKEYCVESARNIVSSKLGAMIKLCGDSTEARRLEGIAPLIARKTTLDSLRGVEGFASAVYFSHFKTKIPNEYNFNIRQRRPAFDPVNACLNLGYTLLTNEISSMIEANGLDPHFGVYHRLSYGRPSLALDVIEEFRANVIDRLVMYLFKNRAFPEKMYSMTDAGCRLSEDALSVYFANYEKKVRTVRPVIRKRAEYLVECFEKNEVYKPDAVSC